MPRDYIQEAASIIFNDSIPLAELVEVNRNQVIGNLLRALEFNKGLDSTMIRKAAAYVLGQIGEPATLKILREQYNRDEEAPGVKDALVASMTAIKLAPAQEGHSQLERRQIIEDVYERRRHPDWKGEIMSPGKFMITLRSQSLSNLSSDDVERMFKQLGLYDRSLNETGKGIRHQYEAAELHDKGCLLLIT